MATVNGRATISRKHGGNSLSLFQLFFDDKVVERIHVITHTSAYAESATKLRY